MKFVYPRRMFVLLSALLLGAGPLGLSRLSATITITGGTQADRDAVTAAINDLWNYSCAGNSLVNWADDSARSITINLDYNNITSAGGFTNANTATIYLYPSSSGSFVDPASRSSLILNGEYAGSNTGHITIGHELAHGMRQFTAGSSFNAERDDVLNYENRIRTDFSIGARTSYGGTSVGSSDEDWTFDRQAFNANWEDC